MPAWPLTASCSVEVTWTTLSTTAAMGSGLHAATAPVDPFTPYAASVNDRFRLKRWVASLRAVTAPVGHGRSPRWRLGHATFIGDPDEPRKIRIKGLSARPLRTCRAGLKSSHGSARDARRARHAFPALVADYAGRDGGATTTESATASLPPRPLVKNLTETRGSLRHRRRGRLRSSVRPCGPPYRQARQSGSGFHLPPQGHHEVLREFSGLESQGYPGPVGGGCRRRLPAAHAHRS